MWSKRFSILILLSLLFFQNQVAASASFQILLLDEAKKTGDKKDYDLSEIDTSMQLPLLIHKTGDGTYRLSNKIINPPPQVRYQIDAGDLEAQFDSEPGHFEESPFVDNAHYHIEEEGGLKLSSHNLTMASLSGGGTVSGWRTSILTLNQAIDTKFSGNWVGGGYYHRPILIKKGAGRIILAGKNIFLGNVFIDEGTVAIDSEVLFGSSAIEDPAECPLIFRGGIFSNLSELDLTDQYILLEKEGGVFDTQGHLLIRGEIKGPGGFTKKGDAILSLSGHNSYKGTTVIKGGTLKAEKANALVQGDYQIERGELDLNNFDLTMTSLSGGGGRVSMGLASLTVDQAIDTEFNGVIAGQGRLIKKGMGSLTLSSVNSYEGTSIDEGFLVVSQDENLGDSRGDLVFNGGALKNIGEFSTHRNITLKEKSGLFETQANLIVEGNIQGPGSLIKNNIGTLVLSGLNFYKGGTYVEQGILKAGSPTAFPQHTKYRVMKGGELDLNSYDLTVSELSGDGGFVSLGSAKLTVNQDKDTHAMYSGNIVGAGSLIKTGLGQFTLSGHSTYQGETVIQKGTLSIDGSIQSNTMIKPEGILIGTGTIHGTVTNEGTLSPGHSIGRFTIEGDYIGKEGSSLQIEFSPESHTSDQLIIKGHASGSTAVELISLQALGGPLPENGIEMIKTGSSTSDAFFLATPLKASAYSYNLIKGENQSWSLRNVSSIPEALYIITPVSMVLPVPSVPQNATIFVNSGFSTTASFPSTIQTVLPTWNQGFRIATQVFPLSPFLLQEYGANLIGNLHQRKGTESSLSEPTNLKDKTTHTLWTRILGEGGRLNTYGRLDYDLRGLQIGGDLYRAIHENGSQDHLGVYGVLGKAKSTIKTGSIRLGDQNVNASSLGGYWTHYGSKAQYLDTVLQATRYHNTLTTRLENDYLKPNTTSYAVSVEGGYPIKVKCLVIEPQAQVVYQRLGLHTYQDPVSIIAFDDTNSLRGRIGLRLPYETVMTYSKGRPCDVTVALTGNLWREFIARNRTTFSTLQNRYPVTFAPDLMGTWAEVGIEGSIQVSQLIALYVNGNYIQGLNAVKRQALGGSMGIRVNW